MTTSDTKNQSKNVPDFPIVGIGTSVGGLDILKKILTEIPKVSNMAYVIQHTSSDFNTDITQILTQHTQIPVNEIINTVSFVPNNIYIIPVNNIVVVENGVLKLHQITRNDKKNNTIDTFFESLAQVHKSAAIGILLSGTAFDGTLGLKKIKELGGITIAQLSQTAEIQGMFQSAVDTDVVDFSLTPENIARQLMQINKTFTANDSIIDTNDTLLKKDEEDIINKIIDVILLRTNNDFSHYKQPAIRRRIAKRMIVSSTETLQHYYNHLRNDQKEQDLLFNDIISPVTYFFRDEKFFENLPKLVFPELIQNIKNNTLRIWVAGCATGEEAYSLAISIHEYLTEKNLTEIKVQLFASDISKKSIKKARTASYSSQDVQHLSAKRLDNYFTHSEGKYHINKVIRDSCIFAVHNFIKDAPFAKIDLICCRNVLCYLQPFLQIRAFNSFYYSLNEKGFLILGKDERITIAENLFENFENNEKIYTRKFNSITDFKQTFQNDLITDNQTLKPEVNPTDETQSSKEELMCLNDELLDRQEQLDTLRNYSESITKTIREPLVTLDLNFIVKSANSAFYNFFKTTEKETEGFSFFEIGNCHWDIPLLREQILKIRNEKMPIENFKTTVSCTGIGEKTLNINAHPVLNAKPDEALIVLAIEDMTDLTNTDELLKIKISELEANNNLLKTFTTSASSDLQEPLSKIQIFGKRIFESEDNLSEATKHNLERILFSAANTSQLVTDLIEYSRINFIKEYKKTDLNLVIKKTLNDLKHTIKKNNVLITFDTFPQLAVFPHQIQQLFTHLIMNAVKFSKDDLQLQIKIESLPASEEEIIEIGGNPEKKYAKIGVSDNGIGFGKEYENRVFDPFYKLHNKVEYSGSGLGLTIVKKIVENHNGFIKAVSSLNIGTTIFVYIPM